MGEPKGPGNSQHDNLEDALKKAEGALDQLKKDRDETFSLRREVMVSLIKIDNGTMVGVEPERIQFFRDQVRDLTFEIGKYNIDIERIEQNLKDAKATKAAHDARMKKPGGTVN